MNPAEDQLIETQDAVVEMAKDLILWDFSPLLRVVDDMAQGKKVALPAPLFFMKQWAPEKTEAFRRVVISLHAARHAANDFRIAHLDEEKKRVRSAMERQFAEELSRIDGLTPEEIAARRAS